MPTPKAGYFIDGERVPGTTTIIGRWKDSGALMQWAFRQGQSGAARLYDESEKAADIGTEVHRMVEAHTHDEPIICQIQDEHMKVQAMQAYQAYERWESINDIKILRTEMQLVSTKYRYGGTPDAIGIVGNEMCLLDYKTSNAVYPDHLIQLAAYIHLWEENYPDQPLVGGAHLLRFSKEHGDFAHHHYRDLSEEWQQFVAFRECYERDKRITRRAK